MRKLTPRVGDIVVIRRKYMYISKCPFKGIVVKKYINDGHLLFNIKISPRIIIPRGFKHRNNILVISKNDISGVT